MNKFNFLFLTFMLIIKNSSEQANQSISLTPIEKNIPANCAMNQYYDLVDLNCKNCPLNSFSRNEDSNIYIFKLYVII